MSIDIKPLVTGKDIPRGGTIRINHTDCGAGQDTRRRLYLTRPAASPNVVLGYCHNCQESGFYSSIGTNDVQYRGHFEARHQVDVHSGVDFKVPKDMQAADTIWPTDAQAWRIKKGLTVNDCVNADIQYDPATHRVYIPMWDTLFSGHVRRKTSILHGFQLVRLNDRGSKYLNVYRYDDTAPCTRIVCPRKTEDAMRTIGFLVEDLASGIRLSNCMTSMPGVNFGAEILVNYGTKVTPSVLALPEGVTITDGIVWLDNDSIHVADQALKIAKVWHMLTGAPIHIEDTATDPKALHFDEILSIINRHIKWK